MAELFSAFSVKDLEIKNRIVMAPMCMYMAKDGYASDWHMIHYATRAMGGVGLIIVEATAVVPEGRISPDDLGLWSDDQMSGLQRIVEKVHEYGGKIGIQLAHAGRKAALPGERILAPSALAFSGDYQIPAQMEKTDIVHAVNAFGAAAKRALAIGFDIIEIHGAHGYLINQFLSPLTNKRSDEYGGTLAGRSRFLMEVIASVRQEWPMSKPVMLRVSGEEYDPEGNRAEDVAQIINHVKGAGLDIAHVSSGGVVPKMITTYPGYQLEIGKKIKEMTAMPTVVGGLITETNLAEEILWNQRGDLVFLGRELLRNPYWALQASKSLGLDIQWPKTYERSRNVRRTGF